MFPINDTLDVLLVGTFLFGVLFTVGSLLLGFADFGVDAHGGHGIDSDHGFGSDHGFAGLLNVSSILAFLTWFGGLGYIFRNGFGWIWPIALIAAVVGGYLAAWLAFQFVRRILRSPDDTLNPRDFERVGVLARVTSSIRAGGVGEIVWEQRGARVVTSAKATGEEPIPRGTEVLILRVDKGMAIVEPFESLLDSESSGRAAG